MVSRGLAHPGASWRGPHRDAYRDWQRARFPKWRVVPPLGKDYPRTLCGERCPHRSGKPHRSRALRSHENRFLRRVVYY
ncbi:hypothetical protein ATCV1_z172R [Acanthocystis turfacea chlorella virus 1]|uniref:Uncharacterized protein z172R n=1 Tax=Chlorovirus heliozoae TaxID=322019 RepID=A7K8D2_9PHYC|nr:hypothetical protein ATCV1_z172R [Acanthocystis turfacea chlorella virus 1]ABT16306.1 hypothetical protein ATCV1_z172R [Acanthocystis turfacea chlorella virus 1]